MQIKSPLFREQILFFYIYSEIPLDSKDLFMWHLWQNVIFSIWSWKVFILSSTHALQQWYKYISDKLHDTAGRGQDIYSGDRASVPDPHIALPCDWWRNNSPQLWFLYLWEWRWIFISAFWYAVERSWKINFWAVLKSVVLAITSTLLAGEISKA